MDVRGSLGLPPDASDEYVERVLADLRTRALENLAGPDGFTGTAESHEATVFTSYRSIEEIRSLGIFEKAIPSFDHESVELFQLKLRPEGDYEVAVRVRKPDAPTDPKASRKAARK